MKLLRSWAKRVAIRPDVLIEQHSRPVAVADVKYKRASSGVANDDVYQALPTPRATAAAVVR